MQRNLIYFLYRLIQIAAFPLIVIYLLLRGFRDRRYFHHMGERFGLLPHAYRRTAGGAVWLHAVSVGEVLSAVHLLEQIRAEYPTRHIYVSSTTLAGRALAVEKLSELVDGVFYAPIDYCFAVRNLLRHIRPAVAIIMETEIWPQWYREIKRAGAGLLIVNGRISDKAISRYRAGRALFRQALSWPDVILAQSETAARRYVELGADERRVIRAGNLKYDFDPSGRRAPEAVSALIRNTGPSDIWIAASTMPPVRDGDVDEDDVVIDAFARLAPEHPGLLLILVPRRPARFDEAANKLRAAGIPFVRRTELEGAERLDLPGVLLLDTIGELSGLFSLESIVFMGGTLAERGGHNILEPAFFGRPIITGPHMENFPAIIEEFREGGGVSEISGAEELAGRVDRMLRQPEEQKFLGERGRAIAESKRGATVKALRYLHGLSAASIPVLPHPLVVRCILTPLTWLWRAGSRWKRGRAMRGRRALDTPVVSIGGIGMGGSGKTPFTMLLAAKLREYGYAPAILTRGYRRRVPEKSTVLPVGAAVEAGLTGDEAQLYLRAAVAPVGIGADRYSTGRLVEERFAPDVVLLDDGFQHWRLDRCLDFVLIDALNPFAAGELFPLGRLREPLEALGRADAFLITRIDAGSPVKAITDCLRRYNRHAPVFLSRVRPVEWVDAVTDETAPLDAAATIKPAAFCALANPAAFWRSLNRLGCQPIRKWKFGDHHHYRPWELQRMASQAAAAGADALLTTEKDLMNLPPDVHKLIDPLRLLWLRIGVEIEDEQRLMDFVRGRIGGVGS